jgi:predicted nucleotidyltransferase
MAKNKEDRNDIYGKIVHQKRYLQKLGYNVLYIGLFGSQNYGLDDENSDIDLRAIVLPTLEQLIKKERVSEHIETDLGLIDVKDVIDFHDVIIKGNFAYLEAIHTKWYIGDEYIRTLFGDIKLNLRSLKGDMYGKAKAFISPYSTKEMKKGYESKELYHLIRLLYLTQEQNTDISFVDYSNNEQVKQYLLDIKKNKNDIIENLDFIDITSFETIKEWIETVTKDLIPKEYNYKTIDIIDKVVDYTKKKIADTLIKNKYPQK